MASPWVAVLTADIVARWRPLTDAEQGTILQLIEDAQDTLERKLEILGVLAPPSPIDERWQRLYKQTVASMVIRFLRNPEGFLRETSDGYEYQRDRALAAGVIAPTDSELDLLVLRRRRGAFSIRPS